MKGDIKLVDGDLNFIGGKIQRIESLVEAVAQKLKIRFGTLIGSWELDQNFGVDWLESILVKNPDIRSIETLIKSEIVKVSGVDQITSFALAFDSEGLMTIEFVCDVVDGAIVKVVQKITTEQEDGNGFSFVVL